MAALILDEKCGVCLDKINFFAIEKCSRLSCETSNWQIIKLMASINRILFRSILPHPGMPNLSLATLYPTLIDTHSDGEVYLAKDYISEQRILHLLAQNYLLIFNVMGLESGFFGYKVRSSTTWATTTTRRCTTSDVIGIFFDTNLFSPFVRISMSPGNVRWCRTRAATAPPVAGVQEKMSPLRKARKKEILSRLIAATFIFFLFLSFWGVLNGVNAQTRIE